MLCLEGFGGSRYRHGSCRGSTEERRTEMEKVKYIGCSQQQIDWGGNSDPRGVLEVGEVYEVEHKEVHNWHTKLSLVGIKGKFNSVCFEFI
jgi:hypothetical protein